MTEITFRFGPTARPTSLAEHLRVEVVDGGHPAWAALRQRMRGSVRFLEVAGRLSARQAIVAAFLDGRIVAHACFHVEPARSPDGPPFVIARMDARVVDGPFADTAVDQVLRQMTESRARTMGCRGFGTARPWPLLAA